MTNDAPNMKPDKKPVPLWKSILGHFYRFDTPPPRLPEVKKLTIQPSSPPAVIDASSWCGKSSSNCRSAALDSSGKEVEAQKNSNDPVVESGRVIAEECPARARVSSKKNLAPPVVTFRNVTKIFDEGSPEAFTALEDVSFEIDDIPDVGEFIAIIGPSGCGKSTILNLIQGFPGIWPPTSGEILVRNVPVTGPGKDRGMIFQKYSSFPNRTVLSNVTMGLEFDQSANGYSKIERQVLARDIIKRVGLEGHEHKFPCQLSGGQQQRVAIARSLIMKPRIILMDEPFSALDEPTRIEMQELVTDLWHKIEATVFIVTHSLAEAVFLSDRVFLMSANPGKLRRIINIKPKDIGKEEGMPPLDVQEGEKFKEVLKEVSREFTAQGGGDG